MMELPDRILECRSVYTCTKAADKQSRVDTQCQGALLRHQLTVTVTL